MTARKKLPRQVVRWGALDVPESFDLVNCDANLEDMVPFSIHDTKQEALLCSPEVHRVRIVPVRARRAKGRKR